GDGAVAEVLITGAPGNAPRTLAAAALAPMPGVRRLTVSWSDSAEHLRSRTFEVQGDAWRERSELSDIHPDVVARLRLERLADFELEPVSPTERVHVFRARARQNARDERLLLFAEVYEPPAQLGANTPPEEMRELERA